MKCGEKTRELKARLERLFIPFTSVLPLAQASWFCFLSLYDILNNRNVVINLAIVWKSCVFKAFYGWHDPCKVRESHACQPSSVSHVLQGFIPTAALIYFTTEFEAQLVTGYGKYIPYFFEYWEAWRVRWYYVCKLEGPVGCVPCNADYLRVLFKVLQALILIKKFYKWVLHICNPLHGRKKGSDFVADASSPKKP